MTYKLQLYRSPADDPDIWNKFLASVRNNLNSQTWMPPDKINPFLKRYNAQYIVVDRLHTREQLWDDYVLFESEQDYFMFLLEWS